MMDNKEAVEVIRSNWPPVQYTMLREALTMAIAALEAPDLSGDSRTAGSLLCCPPTINSKETT